MRASLLALVALALLGCNTSGACFSATGPNSSLCVQCFTAHCAAELSACYGVNWQSNNFNDATCTTYAQCIQNCGCGNPSCPDKVCNQACLLLCTNPAPTSPCGMCLSAMDACREQQCGTSCRDTSESDDDGGI